MLGILQPDSSLLNWTRKNSLGLLVDGDIYFPRMLAAIRSARKQILISAYLVESGEVFNRFFQALSFASENGVEVFLLLDDYGCRGLSDQDREKLSRNRFNIKYFNPLEFRLRVANLYRNHQKLLIVDGNVTFIGGTGIIDEFLPETLPGSYWREVMIELQGEISSNWSKLFFHYWGQSDKTREHVVITPKFSGDSLQCRIAVSQGPKHNRIIQSLVHHVRTAQHRVWIASPYFVTTRKLRRSLRRAANRGVDVRLILASENSDHPWVTYAVRNQYSRLLRYGIRIFEYRNIFNHAKLALCDQWISSGSCNFDRWNQRWNIDANLEILDANVANKIEIYLLDNIALSSEITLDKWKQRSFKYRIKEWYAVFFVRILEKLSQLFPVQACHGSKTKNSHPPRHN